MKKIFLAAIILLNISAFAQFTPFQREGSYQVYLDLNAVQDDELPVQIITPILDEDSVEFHLPRIIPGTYDVHNYGRFLSDFKAQDASGNELETKKLDLNRWRVYDAKNLYRISYKMDDTFDEEEPMGIFQPAGTSLEDSVFLLNNFGFVGYLNGHDDQPFELRIEKPRGFYGSTALTGQMGDTLDVFQIPDYFTLHDNPLMYCQPDTAVKSVGGAQVLVSVYSPKGEVNAAESMQEISAVLDAAADYLGGNLPVEKYAVLIYCVPLENAGTSYGALEHQTSTVLYMPEFGGERFYSGVRDITSHEFFHIVTPLGIHSEMINDFDFIDPEMSRHIWLYEGVTEYNSHLVQALSGIYDAEEFLEVIRNKMNSADGFDEDIPLTTASEHTLTFFKDWYYNFYQKGALAGMALDLKLLELSEGDYRLVDLLEELGKTYGADTFFVDDNLFDIITEMTYPEMREFFALHYESAVPFPYEELLQNVGILYQESIEVEQFTFGNVEFGFNFETGRVKVGDVSEIDKFGRALGWQEGDEIIEFQGEEVNLGNLSDVVEDFYENTEVGDKVKAVVARPQGDGTYKNVKLKTKAIKGAKTVENILSVDEGATAEQVEMRKVWINQ